MQVVMQKPVRYLMYHTHTHTHTSYQNITFYFYHILSQPYRELHFNKLHFPASISERFLSLSLSLYFMLYKHTVILIQTISPANVFVSEFHSLSLRVFARSVCRFVSRRSRVCHKYLQIRKWLFMPIFANMWTRILFPALSWCRRITFSSRNLPLPISTRCSCNCLLCAVQINCYFYFLSFVLSTK